MGLLRFLAKRLLLMLGVLFGVSIVIFVLSRGFPGRYPPWVQYLSSLSSNPSPLVIEQIKAEHGFNLPLYEQYFFWLRDVFSGNWGISVWAGNLPTYAVFAKRFPLTVELAVSALIVTLAIGIPLGILSATRSGKLPDHFARLVSISGYSLPVFWLGYLLQLLFAYYFKIWNLPYLPSSGAVDTAFIGTVPVITGIPVLDSLLEGNIPYFQSAFAHLILPTLTLSLSLLGYLTRTVRSSMLEVLRQDYIIQARSKGLSERVVIYRHALRNALIPAITIMGLIFAFTLGGVVVIEYVFSWPGVGWASLQAIFVNDSSFLMLFTIVSAAIIGMSNLAVDVIYGILDPRIRLK
jgi:peptide/nickel transport system permease protein